MLNSVSIELNVALFLLDIWPPTVIHIAGEMTVLDNTNATYQCNADGSPEPIKMYDKVYIRCIHPLTFVIGGQQNVKHSLPFLLLPEMMATEG